MTALKQICTFVFCTHLVFWYESEVQNGGHGQYFENCGFDRLTETVMALIDLGLSSHAKVLSRAASAISAEGREVDWVDVLHDDLIEELDTAFHNCTPTIIEALELHLKKHREEYVELI